MSPPGSEAGRAGRASSSTRSPGDPTPTVGCAVDRGGERLARRERLLGVPGSRSSALRCTAAAIASHGSSGETGASEPIASSTPSSSIQRNAKQRSDAARPDLLGQVAVVEQVRGLHAAADAELGHPPDVVAADQLRVLDRAAGAGLGVRRQRLGDGRVADRVGRHLEPVRRAPGRAGRAARRRRGWPAPRGTRGGARRRTARSTTRCGCSGSRREMIFSGPIVARSSQPGRVSPVRRPGAITSSRVSAYVAIRIRSRSQPAAQRSAHSGAAAAELEVDDPDDPHGPRPPRGCGGRPRGDVPSLPTSVTEPGVRREPLGLAHHRVAHRHREVHQRGGVEPGVVAVAADQDHRGVPGRPRRARRP